MKNKYKIFGNKQANRMNMMMGIFISIILLIFSMGVSAAPEITGVGHSPDPAYTNSGAITISWTTDESSTTWVSCSNGVTESSSQLTIAHSESVGSFSAGDHNCTVGSCNATGNCSNQTYSFPVTLPPCPAPSIGSVSHTAGPLYPTTDITVTWNTGSMDSTATVYVYKNNSLEKTVNGEDGVSHLVDIGAFAAGNYNYTVESCNTDTECGINNCSNSSGHSFTVTNPNYDVNVTPNSSTGSGDSLDKLNFNIKVTNTGDVDDTFNLTITQKTCPDATLASTQLGPMPSGNFDNTNLEITLIGDSDECQVTVRATSQGDPSKYDETTITLDVSMGYAVKITADNLTKYGAPGEVVNYTLTVTNEGGYHDKYDIDYSPIADPERTLSEDFVDCAAGWCYPGNSEQITLTVEIPSTANSGTQYNTIVTAESNEDSDVEYSINLTTIVGSTYNFSLSCASPSNCYKTGDAGTEISYKLRINNLGSSDDIYDIDAALISGSATATLNQDSINASAYSNNNYFYLTVNLPAGTPQGSSSDVNITVTSQGDPSLKWSVIITANTSGSASGVITNFTAPENASIGQDINFAITFWNTGGIEVNATPEVIITDSSGTEVDTITGTSQNVANNDTFLFNIPWTVSGLTPGESYGLTPQVNYEGSYVKDNAKELPFYILMPADIEVTPQQITKTISPGIQYEINITIKNIGDIGSGNITNIGFNPTGDYILPGPSMITIHNIPTSTFNLAPGESNNLVLNMNASGAGSGAGIITVYYTSSNGTNQKQVNINITVENRPILTLIPDTIEYTGTVETTSGTLSAAIKNIGNSQASVTSITAINLDTINMSIISPFTPFSVFTGAGYTKQLDYSITIPADASGTYTGQLEIKYTNGTPGSTEYIELVDISVIAVVNTSSMSVSPTSISITKLYNSPSEHRTITITNNGNVDLTDIQITHDLPSDVSTSFSATNIGNLASGTSTTIDVTIRIPDPGKYEGNIIINATNIQNLTKTIHVTVESVTSMCGNGILESGEECERNSDCESHEECKNCICERESSSRGSSRCLKLEDIEDYAAKIGDTVKIKVEIENCGRRDETNIDLFIDECPEGWTCKNIKDIEIDEDDSETFYLEIAIPDDAVKKTYKLTVEVDNKDNDKEIFKLVVGAQCSKDSDCDSDEYCKNGVCVPKGDIGDSCTRSDGSECESGICSGGECIECESDNDCDSDEYCSLGECLNKKGVGENCSENYECATESCVDNKCIECESSGDCDSNEYCDGGVCKNLKGLGDSCESSEECETGRCENYECACVSASDCASDEYCENGECKKKITEKLLFNIIITPENVTIGDTITIKATSNGVPVKGAVVSISIGNKTHPTLTNENGEANFTVNETGVLNIIVSKSGYTEFATEISIEEKKEPGFWNLWNIFKLLIIFVILLFILILILIFGKRKKDDEDEKSLQTLRGFREKFDYTSHEIKEKIKEMIPSKVEEESEGTEKKAETKVKKQEVVKKPVKKPVKAETKEEPELLSIEDIELPPIGEIVKDKKEEPAEVEKGVVKEEKGRGKEDVVKEEKKPEKKKKGKLKKEDESAPWSDLLEEK